MQRDARRLSMHHGHQRTKKTNVRVLPFLRAEASLGSIHTLRKPHPMMEAARRFCSFKLTMFAGSRI